VSSEARIQLFIRGFNAQSIGPAICCDAAERTFDRIIAKRLGLLPQGLMDV